MAFNHELTGAVGHLVQVLSNLCNESTLDPTIIMPEVPTRKIEGDVPPKDMPDFVHLGQIYFYRLFLSYLFGRYSQAYDIVLARESFVDKIPVRHAILADETFYTGLTAVAVAREKGDDTLLVQARQCLDNMKGFCEQCRHNFEHKRCLLEAEIAVYDCKYDKAASLYDDAIHIAGEHGFVHEQGLAHEKAGSFYYGLNRSKSLQHFKWAKKYFLQWGSPRKVRDLEQRYSIGSSST
uniref:KIF-binding protein n=1 Tax=Minutocellus polymorphus TaxID=265543 RepID=A0A7S0FPS5_9STRA